MARTETDGSAEYRVLIVEDDCVAAQTMPVIRPLRDQGKSLRAIAGELTARGIRTRRGGPWSAAAVNAVLAREAAIG